MVSPYNNAYQPQTHSFYQRGYQGNLMGGVLDPYDRPHSYKTPQRPPPIQRINPQAFYNQSFDIEEDIENVPVNDTLFDDLMNSESSSTTLTPAARLEERVEDDAPMEGSNNGKNRKVTEFFTKRRPTK